VPQRADDPSISNDERLWRRVHPSQFKPRSGPGPSEVSSGVFSTREEVSVAIASETTLEALVANCPHHSVIAFTAGAARAAGCTVVRDPLPDDPAHALVCGSKPNGQLTKAQQELLKQSSTLILFRDPDAED
jgi:hypothetical protein